MSRPPSPASYVVADGESEVEKKRRVNQEGEYNPQWWYYQGEPGEVNLPTVYTSGPKQIGGLRGKASHYRLEITLVQTQDLSQTAP